jgi:LmbE family N-acetylglucosaminyl deacetylase
MIEQLIQTGSRILIVAPHADDEALGCGGLIAFARRRGAAVFVLFMTCAGFEPLSGGCTSTDGQREDDLRAAVNEAEIADYDVVFGSDKHLLLDTVPQKTIISAIESASKCSLRRLKPDILLIPSPSHNHQDHRAVHSAAIAACRNPSVAPPLCLEYEIPGTGLLGYPALPADVYVGLSTADLDSKQKHFSRYASQVATGRGFRSHEAIQALAHARGIESGFEYAEAFHMIRLKIGEFNSDRLAGLYSDSTIHHVNSRLETNQAGTFNLTLELLRQLQAREHHFVLDAGCGSGVHLSKLRDTCDVYAFGIDPGVSQLPDPRIVFRQAPGERLPFPSASMDRIICNYALYYMDHEAALAEMLRVVKPRSRIVISGPATGNNDLLYSTHMAAFGRLSELDDKAISFLEGTVEHLLRSWGIEFSASTFDNIVTFTDQAAFLDYYRSTTLFRLWACEVPEGEIVRRFRAFLPIGPIVNRKRVRILVIDSSPLP